MTQIPIIAVHSEVTNATGRAQQMREIFECAARHVASDKEFRNEAWYWPGSIVRIECMPDVVTVHWSESVVLGCFQPAFAAAWDELGDDTPVAHIATDDLNDTDPPSARWGD